MPGWRRCIRANWALRKRISRLPVAWPRRTLRRIRDCVPPQECFTRRYANGLQVECSLDDRASAAMSRARRIAAVRGLKRLNLLTDIQELRHSEPGKQEALARRVLLTMPKGIWNHDP